MTSPLPLLVFADDWGRHPSSCQHLIRRIREDFSVVWVNTVGTRRAKVDRFTLSRGIEKLRSWNKGLQQVADRMWVVDVPMLPNGSGRLVGLINQHLLRRRLDRTLRRLNLSRPIVLTTLPHFWPWISDIERTGLIYYCVDDFTHWPGADGDTVRAAELSLLGQADVVLAASRELQTRLSHTRTTAYFPHAVDFEHFAAASTGDSVAEVEEMPRPRIGFFGLIYEKLDFRLLGHIANQFPEGSLVMIGPASYCPEEFRRLPNVRFTGAIPYSELPSWIAGCDVLVLAYKHDEMTRQINPLKLKECLATGKPVISVNFSEAAKFSPHVRLAAGADDFVNQIREALTDSEEGNRQIERRRLVESDSWETRAEELGRLIDELVERRSASAS
jgi:glycosyltransferase involved in cell wall biosynthesis